MKNYISFLLLSLLLFAAPINLQAQFLKKLQKKIDKKLDQVFATDENESASENTSDPTYDSSEYTANYKDFITGNTIIFSDKPDSNEVLGTTPSKWETTFANAKDNSEIIMYSGEKVIRLGSRQGISPVINKNKEDYIPDDFTLEFDASFSANALEQRYYINFYNLKTQKDMVESDTRYNELTFTTFGVTDDMTEGTLKGHKFYEESPTLIWRHIALTSNNNTIDVYYDGQHVFHKTDVKGNFIGITISRSELSSSDRYLKNIKIATNL